MSKKNSTSRAPVLQSVLPGVPMLSLHENNIIDVQEALNTLCLREFQSIGEAIQTLALSTITVVPDAPTDLTATHLNRIRAALKPKRTKIKYTAIKRKITPEPKTSTSSTGTSSPFFQENREK
jgi:hypothetical protein